MKAYLKIFLFEKIYNSMFDNDSLFKKNLKIKKIKYIKRKKIKEN